MVVITKIEKEEFAGSRAEFICRINDMEATILAETDEAASHKPILSEIVKGKE